MIMRFLLVLEHLESSLSGAALPSRKRLPSARLLEAGLRAGRPKFFSAGPPTPLDLAFPWISITGKEMLPRFLLDKKLIIYILLYKSIHN